jgi:hypothetical protein
MICTLCTKHRIEHGSLCTGCTRTTLDHLYRLPRMWASLEAWLAPGATGGIVGVLEDWHAAVCEARGLPAPARAASLQRRITVAASGLYQQIHFIALWEHGGLLAKEVARLVDRVRAVVQPGRALDEPPEPTLLGRCIATVDEDGTVCGHRLYADMTRPVQCGLCLCVYPPDTWLALRHFQPGRSRPLEETAAA